MASLTFGEVEARGYEAWFETREGQRADKLEKALLGRLLEDLGPPGMLLEVGCGTGHFMRWFKAQGWQVAGLDISPAMLAEARRLDPGACLLLAQADALPFPDGAWDVVAYITVLEFVSDVVVAIREGLRVARRGLLLGLLNRCSLLAWWRRLYGLFVPTPYRAAHFFSEAEIKRILNRAASGTSLSVRSRSTLWPRWLPLDEWGLPWGGFLVVRIRKESI